LRFFGGVSIEEAATELGVSSAVVKRHWTVAKAYLKQQLRGGAH
jgi:DNA-directed RNA polymerase specialized sigma24 family protein